MEFSSSQVIIQSDSSYAAPCFTLSAERLIEMWHRAFDRPQGIAPDEQAHSYWEQRRIPPTAPASLTVHDGCHGIVFNRLWGKPMPVTSKGFLDLQHRQRLHVDLSTNFINGHRELRGRRIGRCERLDRGGSARTHQDRDGGQKNKLSHCSLLFA